MKKPKIVASSLILLFLFSNAQAGYCQQARIVNISMELQEPIYGQQNEEAHSKAHTLGQVLLHFYKKYISSQDGPTCSFKPSCSVYALESIEKLGLLPGLMNAADRITRCNSRENIYYEEDETSGLALDPAP